MQVKTNKRVLVILFLFLILFLIPFIYLQSDHYIAEPFSTPTSPIRSTEQFDQAVLVISLNPRLKNGQSLSEFKDWYSYQTLTQQTVDFFYEVTNGRLRYHIIEEIVIEDGWPEKIDGFSYTEEMYLQVLNGQRAPHEPDTVNYNKLINDPALDICGRVNRGEIDEVWIFNGPYFGFYESTLIGPDAYRLNAPSISKPWACAKTIPIMGPSPERALNSMIHNFGHRMEATMSELYGGWEQNQIRNGWEQFALVDVQSDNYSYSGCGSVHYPPNGQFDYDYENRAVPAQSNCRDFKNYPNLSSQPALELVDCNAWQCDEPGYQAYWFGNLPANKGCDQDRKLNDWWVYFADPSLATQRVDCSAS